MIMVAHFSGAGGMAAVEAGSLGGRRPPRRREHNEHTQASMSATSCISVSHVSRKFREFHPALHRQLTANGPRGSTTCVCLKSLSHVASRLVPH